jgi:FkbH-like protein
MYETEANVRKESSSQIPTGVIAQLRELQGKVLERTVLPWSEHCTECVWPTCYSSCDLYSPREDGRCRRFADGMVRIDCPEATNSYLLKIRFKRWGKLWTPGNIRMHAMDKASRIENRDYKIGVMLYQLPAPVSIRKMATGKRYSFKKRMAYRAEVGDAVPTAFLLECYNPGLRTVGLSLTMRSVHEAVKIPFQKLIELTPGFHRVRIPYDEITKFLDLRTPFNVDLTPNEGLEETTLYFGLMDFVRESAKPVDNSGAGNSGHKDKDKARTIKCVVWDLDNTIWDGILVEDGIEKLALKPGMAQVVQDLDQRGILQSVASKNNSDEAMAVLKKFGLSEFFLCPQISWQPKSESVQAIAQRLNIAIDSLLFVDDSEFELQQVKAVHPEIRILHARQYLDIPEMKECNVPVTAESRERRKMYQVEAQRKDIAGNFGNDYLAFLKHCEIRLNVGPMVEDNLERVHELTQRTNQMNFSGNRYDRAVLKQILATPHLDTYVLEVEDRFGKYGVVGFSIVDRRVPLMTDLMFSCRIQSKHVEHAFLAYVIRKYVAETGKDFQVNYRKTPRNAPSGKVFSDLLMQETEINDGVSRLVFAKGREIPDDQIVNIAVRDPVPIG